MTLKVGDTIKCEGCGTLFTVPDIAIGMDWDIRCTKCKFCNLPPQTCDKCVWDECEMSYVYKKPEDCPYSPYCTQQPSPKEKTNSMKIADDIFKTFDYIIKNYAQKVGSKEEAIKIAMFTVDISSREEMVYVRNKN